MPSRPRAMPGRRRSSRRWPSSTLASPRSSPRWASRTSTRGSSRSPRRRSPVRSRSSRRTPASSECSRSPASTPRHWERAAALLQDDPGRETDPSLEFAYGLALASPAAAPAEAEKVFTGLLTRRGDSAELSLLLGQAQAAQDKLDLAVASLQRAVELNPAAEEAHAALGVALMSLGRAGGGSRTAGDRRSPRAREPACPRAARAGLPEAGAHGRGGAAARDRPPAPAEGAGTPKP